MSWPPVQELASGALAREVSLEVAPQPSRPYGPYTASGVILTGRGYVTYWTARETSGAAASAVRLWDSPTASGRLIASLGMLANQGNNLSPGEQGILCVMGVFLEIVSGAAEIAIGFRYSE